MAEPTLTTIDSKPRLLWRDDIGCWAYLIQRLGDTGQGEFLIASKEEVSAEIERRAKELDISIESATHNVLEDIQYWMDITDDDDDPEDYEE